MSDIPVDSPSVVERDRRDYLPNLREYTSTVREFYEEEASDLRKDMMFERVMYSLVVFLMFVIIIFLASMFFFFK